MKKLIALATATALLAGCGTPPAIPLDSNTADALKGQNLIQSARKKPDFTAMTAGKAAFAVLGAFAMISAGNEIVATNNVADPADAIARELSGAIAASRGARVVAGAVPAESDDAGALAAAAKGRAQFVLDVQTINWSFAYFPSDWSHYRVMYVARGRLIDTASGKTVAEGSCKRIPDSNVGAPTHDELVGNNAAGLKRELAIAAAECVATLKKDMLAM